MAQNFEAYFLNIFFLFKVTIFAMAPVLAYWNLRGLAQPIRYLLEYLGEPYEQKLMDTSEYPEWMENKFSLGFDFPNLPYYIDGDFKLTQSNAILRYIAAKHGMMSYSDPKEMARLDMIDGAIGDLRMGMGRLFYGEDFEKNKVTYLENLPTALKPWSTLLATKTYIMGDKIQYSDFVLFEILDVLLYLEPNVLANQPVLQKYYNTMKNLPKLNAYLKSPKCIHWPLAGSVAKFGTGPAPKLHTY